MPKMLCCAVMISGGDDCRVVWEVIEQRCALFKEKWQIVFASAWTAPRADVDIGRTQIMINLETVIPIHLEPSNGRWFQRVFAGGEEVYAVHLGDGALGLGVEGTQRINLVIQ